MAMVLMPVPPEVAENLAVPVEFELKVTVSAVVVGLPSASCSWTASGPRVAEAEAGPETDPLMMMNLEGAPAVMLDGLLTAQSNPLLDASRVYPAPARLTEHPVNMARPLTAVSGLA